MSYPLNEAEITWEVHSQGLEDSIFNNLLKIVLQIKSIQIKS